MVGIYVFLSVILLAFAIANITDIYQERKRLGKMLAVAQRMQTLDKLKELDTGHGVPRDTFVLAVLEQLGVLDRENDILPWIKVIIERIDQNFNDTNSPAPTVPLSNRNSKSLMWTIKASSGWRYVITRCPCISVAAMQ